MSDSITEEGNPNQGWIGAGGLPTDSKPVELIPVTEYITVVQGSAEDSDADD